MLAHEAYVDHREAHDEEEREKSASADRRTALKVIIRPGSVISVRQICPSVKGLGANWQLPVQGEARINAWI